MLSKKADIMQSGGIKNSIFSYEFFNELKKDDRGHINVFSLG